MKGNLIIGQSGGGTAVMNCSLVGAIREARKHKEIEGIYGASHGVQGLLAGRWLNIGRLDESTLENLLHTPSAALGSCRYRLKREDAEALFSVLSRLNVRYFLYIGGNDSAQTCYLLSQMAKEKGYDLQVIAIPKTIDNDLLHTDHTPGYGTAARFIALATVAVGMETEALRLLEPVKMLEVKGRNSGWLAAASALAKEQECEPPHLIYFPERPFLEGEFLADVEETYRKFGYVVAVVSETIRDRKGNPVGASSSAFVDDFGNPYGDGPARYLCHLVQQKLGLRARYDMPGSIQKVSVFEPVEVDRREAYAVGEEAVKLARAGESDCMVTLIREPGPQYRCTTDHVTLEEVIDGEKKLPAHFVNERGTGVTSAFLHYARPLAGGSFPRYVRLTRG